ncbi:MAG: hypothetical protein R6U96_17335 [Promethearchaeia archaeon]
MFLQSSDILAIRIGALELFNGVVWKNDPYKSAEEAFKSLEKLL